MDEIVPVRGAETTGQAYGVIADICVDLDASVDGVIAALSVRTGPRVGSGIALVLDSSRQLVGIITDADLRKGLASQTPSDLTAQSVMQSDFLSVDDNHLPSEALSEITRAFAQREWETESPVRAIPILGNNREPIGLLDISGRERELLVNRDVAIVVGQGFVGQTLAAVLAASGIRTIGVETNMATLRQLRRGRTGVLDEGLVSLIRETTAEKTLTFVGSLTELPSFELGRRRIFVVTVGTPVTDGNSELDALDEVVRAIGNQLRKGDVIVLRSTVPVGTTSNVARQLEEASGLRVGLDFFTVSAPERTAEGVAVTELRTLPQVVGGVTSRCTEAGLEFFRLFAKTVIPAPSAEFSELVKLASNAFRDYSFAFSNYLADVASGFNIDVNSLIDTANFGYDRNRIAAPSPGVGGPCLSKDPFMMPNPTVLGSVSRPNIIHEARHFNEGFVDFQIQRILRELPAGDSAPIAALGLAFKGAPETNDTRGSTGVSIVHGLRKQGVNVHVWDALLDNPIDGLEKVHQKTSYRGVLLLNNHRANVDMALLLVSQRADGDIVIFDPWRLMDRSPHRGELHPHLGITTLLSLSHSTRVS